VALAAKKLKCLIWGECSRSSFILASENEIRIAIEDAVVSLTIQHIPHPPNAAAQVNHQEESFVDAHP